MRLTCLLLILCAALPCTLYPAALLAGPLTVYTEEYPPYNTKATGTVTGLNTEKILAIFAGANVPLTREEIRLVPWSRAYRAALTFPNTCVYSTTLTEERKELFRWVGPLSETTVALVGLRGDASPLSSLDALEGKVGVVMDDVGHQLALSLGIPEEQLDVSATAQGNIRKLKLGRIRYFSYEVSALHHLAEAEGFTGDDFVPVYTLTRGELWLACHPQTAPDLLARLQQALDSMPPAP